MRKRKKILKMLLSKRSKIELLNKEDLTKVKGGGWYWSHRTSGACGWACDPQHDDPFSDDEND